MSHDPTFWLLARASGLAAYALLTLSVLAGLVLKTRPFGPALRAATVTTVHRTLAMSALGLLALHGVSLVLDATVEVSPLGLLVPGLVAYRPVATVLGVLAAELMLVVYLSFGARRRLGMANWRRLHYATYGVFAGATLHGLLAGSDSAQPWALGLYLGAVGAVAAAGLWRALVLAPVQTSQGGSR
ncbi:MAG TPA: ferric reductase-like transmembrane domain-containing protein [Gaiellaceae bacterium]|nr:ferric reductase-like transmembrane domain-containing protein [Gaiellaceae bacterium]